MIFYLREKAIVQGMIQNIADGLNEETPNTQSLKDQTAALADKVESLDPTSLDNPLEDADPLTYPGIGQIPTLQ